MYADAIRRQAEDAPRAALPAVTAALWRALANGQVSEAEAETLSALIEARGEARASASARQDADAAGADGAPAPPATRRTGSGSRPRTDASLERRRRWVASGRLPPALAARFTMGEAAVLAVVAAETVRRRDCRLAVGHLAAIAGVSETTVRNAVREAVRLGLVTVEERRLTGWRNDTNVVRLVSAEWISWLRLAKGRRKGAILAVPRGEDEAVTSAQGGGCKSPQRTPTQILILSESGTTKPSKCCRRAAGDLDRSEQSRIRAGGRTT